MWRKETFRGTLESYIEGGHWRVLLGWAWRSVSSSPRLGKGTAPNGGRRIINVAARPSKQLIRRKTGKRFCVWLMMGLCGGGTVTHPQGCVWCAERVAPVWKIMKVIIENDKRNNIKESKRNSGKTIVYGFLWLYSLAYIEKSSISIVSIVSS